MQTFGNDSPPAASPLPRWARAWALATLTLLAAPVHAAPTPLSDTHEASRSPRDVTASLAAAKASAFQHANARRVAMTPNQTAYDARTYDLDLTFDPVQAQVAGTARMRATVVSGPLNTIDLDFAANMVVDSVTADGVTSSFTRAGDVLTVNLTRAYASGEDVSVGVGYHGQPATSDPFGNALRFLAVDGRTLIWSLSEPYGAHTWWPCKDVPSDKADSVSVRYTVPSGMTTVSNGTRLDATDDGITSVVRWHERHPIATYLVSIASYPYTVSHDHFARAPGDSMPIDFYNFPESAAGVAPVQAKVTRMIAAFTARFGPYPFLDEKYGHAQVVFGGGMENQTCTSIGALDEWVVAHELSHQWWGDHVTCRDFHHIWLNEGFATYAQALWSESQSGLDAYLDFFRETPTFVPGTVFVPDTTDGSRIFDSALTYTKGSWVLHMLRHVIGDTLFFQSLRRYRDDFGGRTAATEDLRDECEVVSGRPLHRFFQQWIYGENYPTYRPVWNTTPRLSGYDVTLRLDQTQAWQLFQMPLDVRITTTNGNADFVVQDSLASQTFMFHVNGTPTEFAVDPDHWVLRKIDQPVTSAAFDRSVLLVNDADWGAGGAALASSYLDSAFTGGYAVDFWDTHATPSGGYPRTLAAPLGHGEVPPGRLGHYRNVIWVSDGQNASWNATPIASYVRAGGNVLLLTSRGSAFVGDTLGSCLGIPSWNLQVPTAAREAHASFVDLPLLAPQEASDLFLDDLSGSGASLLFKAQPELAPWDGLGVLGAPMSSARPYGGHLAYVAGRPDRWDHAALHADVTALLTRDFHEPVSGTAVGSGSPSLALSAPAPNPFATSTSLRMTLTVAAPVHVFVRDVAGRRVRALVDGVLGAGDHALEWDGRDDHGRALPAGLFWIDTRAGAASASRRVVWLR